MPTPTVPAAPSRKYRLSQAQREMLVRVFTSKDREEFTPTGNRKAALSAANWYRTAHVLRDQGLITLVYAGGAQRALLTPEGLAEASRLLQTGEAPDWRVVEGIAGMWSYHLRAVNQLAPDSKPSVCGARVMTTQIPLSAWGHRGHLNEKWCAKCAEHAGLPLKEGK